MSPVNAYLTFNGNATEAMRTYERVLKGKLQALMTFAQAPDMGMAPPEGCAELAPGSENRVMHACLVFEGGGMLMASDTMVGQPYEGMKGFGVALSCATNEEAKRVFDTFADGGQVQMPMMPTFWAEQFGMVTDRFGVPWLINGVAKPMA